MPPIEVFIGPVIGFAAFYLFGWSMRNSVHGMNGPRDYARFAAKAMGALILFGILSQLIGCELGSLDD